MPIVPNLLERLVFFRLNQGPAPLLDLFGAVAFRIIQAALNLGVFDTLSNGPLGAAELARRINADERGMTILLDALEALGYVTKQDDRYANTAMTTKWLLRSSPTSVAAGFDYWATLLSHLWENLEASIRHGQPQIHLYDWIEQHPEASHDFQAWMIAIARLVGDEIVRKLKLPANAHRLLDVGGGHGMYSIALCRRYPGLVATVFDTSEALEAARASITAENMGDQVVVQEGNFRKDHLGAGYDVALLFNIVHGFLPDQNVALLRKVADALNPGGLVVIVEQVADKVRGPTSKASTQILGLSYFHLLGGQIYTFQDIVRWLMAAGFTSPRRINLLKAPGTSLVLATKMS